jgi:hypothetical protein
MASAKKGPTAAKAGPRKASKSNVPNEPEANGADDDADADADADDGDEDMGE